MEKSPLIEFKNVTKRFGERTILENVNFKIFEKDVTTIIGLSGTGKSVLLKHIIGLLQPNAGHILFRGRPIDQMRRREWNDYISQVSYMFQNNALFDAMTVFENVALPLKQTTRLSRRQIEQKALARIEQTELSEVADKYPSEISGGMQKRVALARALVTDPKIVLFDEPTTGQDPIRKNAILRMVAQYQRKFGFTAIMISHEIPDVFFISNRILALWDRQIVFEGTPDELTRFDHPFRDEIVNSLEGLGEELTGLYSKRQFRVRYQSQLSQKNPDVTYACVLFTLHEMDAISRHLGPDAAQQIIRSFGTFITKHFGEMGGFSTRQEYNEFGTVLPFSDVEEAGRILEDFARDIQQHGLDDVAGVRLMDAGSDSSFEFFITAGIAQGKPQIELESVMEFARYEQKEIARFCCSIGGEK